MQTWRPDTVYHAAAYKHVPLVEHNPIEGMRNNVLGTLHVRAAGRTAAGVANFVLISTDKAVRPTNVMGASKRAGRDGAAGVCATAKLGGTTLLPWCASAMCSARSGSVVPLFREQIRSGRPDHGDRIADITRYFMTIPEAAQLVIQAGAMADGGDVFVLDMGEPVRIIDLARTHDRAVGPARCATTPARRRHRDRDHRPAARREAVRGTADRRQRRSRRSHARIMKAQEDSLPWDELHTLLQALDDAMVQNDVATARALLQTCVQGYQPAGEVVDWLHSSPGNNLDAVRA